MVFDHLKRSLNRLESEEVSVTVLIDFELKLLSLTGYQPFLDSCRRCGMHPSLSHAAVHMHWYFSLRDGAILCARCSKLRKELVPISGATLDFMTNLQHESNSTFDDPKASQTILKQIRSATVRFIQFQLNREIKSASFLNQFCF